MPGGGVEDFALDCEASTNLLAHMKICCVSCVSISISGSEYLYSHWGLQTSLMLNSHLSVDEVSAYTVSKWSEWKEWVNGRSEWVDGVSYKNRHTDCESLIMQLYLQMKRARGEVEELLQERRRRTMMGEGKREGGREGEQGGKENEKRGEEEGERRRKKKKRKKKWRRE